MSVNQQVVPFHEKLVFMMTVTGTAGFINAYSSLLHGGDFVTMHTGNMTRMGLSFAEGDIIGGLLSLLAICSCLFGVLLHEVVKNRIVSNNLGGSWQKYALMVEVLMLVPVPFLAPLGNTIVNSYLAIVGGYHFCVFVKWEFGGHNISVSTGNLRTLGQFFFKAVTDSKGSLKTTFKYFLLTFSFPLGTFLGALIIGELAGYAIWVLAAFLLLFNIMLFKSEKAS